MQISFSPQRSDVHVSYVFDGATIQVIIGEVTEFYDFTDMPDGEADVIEQGVLPFSCIIDAEKDSELFVTLLLTHGPDVPENILFPANPMTPQLAQELLILRDQLIPEEPLPEEPLPEPLLPEPLPEDEK